MQDQVHVSHDAGRTWQAADADQLKVVVLAPGAGMVERDRNPDTYQEILAKYPRSVLVEYPGWDAPHRPDFTYPEQFSKGGAEFSVDDQRDDLARFSRKVCAAVMDGSPPVAMWCGSRGCQVSIRLVWSLCWRGPSVRAVVGSCCR